MVIDSLPRLHEVPCGKVPSLSKVQKRLHLRRCHLLKSPLKSQYANFPVVFLLQLLTQCLCQDTCFMTCTKARSHSILDILDGATHHHSTKWYTGIRFPPLDANPSIPLYACPAFFFPSKYSNK